MHPHAPPILFFSKEVSQAHSSLFYPSIFTALVHSIISSRTDSLVLVRLVSFLACDIQLWPCLLVTGWDCTGYYCCFLIYSCFCHISAPANTLISIPVV